eukprot:366449-Chlamydomonas_euryale.AAC.29
MVKFRRFQVIQGGKETKCSNKYDKYDRMGAGAHERPDQSYMHVTASFKCEIWAVLVAHHDKSRSHTG